MFHPLPTGSAQRRVRARRVPVLGAALAALLSSVTPAAAQLPAPPVVGNGPLQIGAYGSVTVARPEHPESAKDIEISELALGLLAWGQITPRTSYFVEVDMAKRSSETWTGREANESFAPVRLYAEYAASNLLRLRVGRFLTPIGQWNERHAEPLTWTPTRPLTTYRPFAKSLNGLLVAGEGTIGRRDVGYAVFWAPSWDPDGDLEEAEESSFLSAFGARAAAELRPGLTLGVSLARLRRSQPLDALAGGTDGESGERADDGEGREAEGGHRAFVGADLRWITPRVELSAEGAWLASYEDQPYEGGAFLLGALHLGGPVWGVGRAEVYRPVDGRTARTGFAGLTVRAGPHFVLKGGRQFSLHPSTKIPDGWFLSFSSLF